MFLGPGVGGLCGSACVSKKEKVERPVAEITRQRERAGGGEKETVVHALDLSLREINTMKFQGSLAPKEKTADLPGSRSRSFCSRLVGPFSTRRVTGKAREDTKTYTGEGRVPRPLARTLSLVHRAAGPPSRHR
eukprot:2386117-Rhodomonas_salina.2